MAIHPAVLLIADIGGYTRFMTVHRINLAHAQEVVAQLLEAILDAAGPFKLAKLEGDAAFLYAKLGEGTQELPEIGTRVAEIRRAFLARQEQLELDRSCTCDGCVQATQLKLKFVTHVGEVAEQRVKRNQELAGVAVITVHRLLKNSVPLSEYVLMTDEVYQRLPAPLRDQARDQVEELEGLGPTRSWYLDLSSQGLAERLPVHPPSARRRFFAWLRLTWRSLPYFVGLKKPCDGFRNLGEIRAPPALEASAPTEPAP